MNIQRLTAIVFVFASVAAAWFVLGTALTTRTTQWSSKIDSAVEGLWGPALVQMHPTFSYPSPNTPGGKRWVQPIRSDVRVNLRYLPKRKGLFWYRTFLANMTATYTIRNETPIAQTFFVHFPLPANTSFADFQFEIGGKAENEGAVKSGMVSGALRLAPQESTAVKVSYETQGRDRWEYRFGDVPKVEAFTLAVKTDFDEIDFPQGTAAATGERIKLNPGWELLWNYPKWLAPPGIGMEMPSVVNPGPVAIRITFFAPVALFFFFTVLVMLSILKQTPLHPMHFFFVGAACFAFQLVFAYSVDLLPVNVAFGIAAVVSLTLNFLYLGAAAGWPFARWAAFAQFAYLVLFSYSFFSEGLTGITITAGAVATLAMLMRATARVSWDKVWSRPESHSIPTPASGAL